jgi:hypothetical protein
MPVWLSYLTEAYAELGKFDDAWRCVSKAVNAMDTTKEKWWEAEVHRVGGEIALKLPDPDAPKAEAYFERSLSIARQQQAKSWELRAAMSMAWLWRDQGKRKCHMHHASLHGNPRKGAGGFSVPPPRSAWRNWSQSNDHRSAREELFRRDGADQKGQV